MKLLIFGSTGSIGRQLVDLSLEQQHTVSAFTRQPGKLLPGQSPLLRIIQGDVLHLPSVERAVQEHDAVLCALGAGRKGGVRGEGTRNIIRAMEKHGVKRLVCQTTLGAGESRNNLNFFWKKIMFGFFLKEAFADHEQQEAFVRASTLDWVIVRPAAFTDGPRTDAYKQGFGPEEGGLKLSISRRDVAAFMLQQLTSDRYLRQAAGLSY